MNDITIKEINNDWKNHFTKLKSIGSNQLFEIVGPLLIGIELVKSKHGGLYRPYLIVCSLFGSDVSNSRAGNDLKNCLNSPEIYFGLNNSKGIQFDVDYRNHRELFEKVIIEIKKQHLSLEKDLKINELFEYFEKVISNYSSSGELALFMEFQYLIALFLNNEKQRNNIIKEIERQKNFWNMEHFEMWIGDYDIWFKNLKSKKRVDLLNSFERIIDNDKLRKLNSFKLI